MRLSNSFFLLLVSAFFACESEDVSTPIASVDPGVVLSSNVQFLSENGGSAQITATLSQEASETVVINLLTSGTATGGGVDFTVSDSVISIPAGSLTGILTINTVQDTLQEGNESIDISIQSAVGVEIEGVSAISVTIEDDDVVAVAQFIINEILYDPSNDGLDGDANQDGVYSQDGDSFIEFYNPSASDFDMGGYEIWDDTAKEAPHFVIPNGTIIPAGGALVVFGEDTPNPTGNFGGATVISAGAGTLNFNNSGEVIGIKEPNGGFILIFNSDALSNNPNESYTRNPDLTGDFEQHADNTTVLFSPGTKIDGSSF